MIKSYKSHSFVNGLKFTCSRAMKENRAKFLFTVFGVIIAIFTGIFIAIKFNNACSLSKLQEIDLDNFYVGFTGSSSAFFSRTLSLTINVVILFGLSFVPFLLPLAEVLLIYRGYLFGLNFALIFLIYGLGGSLTAIIVILPCQLLTLYILILFFLIISKMNSNCKKFGGSECNRFGFLIVVLVILLIINLIETLLLFFLKGTVIMVI